MDDDVEILIRKVYFIYDNTKTALLSKYYYGQRLADFRKYNFWLELLIAFGAAGSGIAGLAFWQTKYGQPTRAVLSTISVISATVKPSLKLTEKIENYAKLYGEYTGAYVKMSIHLQDIQFERKVTEDRLKAFSDLRIVAAELENLGDPVRNQDLVRKLEQQVNRTIPIETLWVPERPHRPE